MEKHNGERLSLVEDGVQSQEGVQEESPADQKGRDATIQVRLNLDTYDMNVSCKEIASLPFVAAILDMARNFVLERQRALAEMQTVDAVIQQQQQAALATQIAGKRLHV